MLKRLWNIIRLKFKEEPFVFHLDCPEILYWEVEDKVKLNGKRSMFRLDNEHFLSWFTYGEILYVQDDGVIGIKTQDGIIVSVKYQARKNKVTITVDPYSTVIVYAGAHYTFIVEEVENIMAGFKVSQSYDTDTIFRNDGTCV